MVPLCWVSGAQRPPRGMGEVGVLWVMGRIVEQGGLQGVKASCLAGERLLSPAEAEALDTSCSPSSISLLPRLCLCPSWVERL